MNEETDERSGGPTEADRRTSAQLRESGGRGWTRWGRSEEDSRRREEEKSRRIKRHKVRI